MINNSSDHEHDDPTDEENNYWVGLDGCFYSIPKYD